MRLHSLDYAVILGYFAVVVAIGWFLRGRAKTADEFFTSARSLSAWVTGLAFMSANLGSLEVMGHAANAAKYGMLAAGCFYWLGAIPAMLFLGVFMMPFYYSNRVSSVPEYLKLRFDERARSFNAISFAVLTIFMSGINMYAMALVFKVFLNWSMDLSIWIAAVTVMVYITLGGLTSAIYNEVLQFFLILAGMLPLSFMALNEAGGWHSLLAKLPPEHTHAVAGLASPESNPMGVPWYAVILGFTIFAGTSYWCTDFLVVQRALAARDMLAARRTPLIAAFFKMLFPFVIVLPGLAGSVVLGDRVREQYNLVIPLLLERYYSAGLLGLGLTALLASFMSGMAGNVTAFNTIWTYDIYRPRFSPNRPDGHYLRVGRVATVVGTLLSVATSYVVMRFQNMGDYLVLIFSLFMFPMSTVFLLGMFWKRTSPAGAFYGMLSGVGSSVGHYFLYRLDVVSYRTEMAANIYIIIASWLTGLVVAIVVSLVTQPRPEEELHGLVYSPLDVLRREKTAWRSSPELWAGLLFLMLLGLLIAFW